MPCPSDKPSRLMAAASAASRLRHGGLVFALACGAVWCNPAFGQVPIPTPRRGFSPIEHPAPPGVAGEWAALTGRSSPVCFQRIRFQLPTAGRVTVFGGGGQQTVVETPGQVGLLVGPIYRFKISHLPEYPGVELYPSIEVLDRIHPPLGRAAEFPVPIDFTAEDIANVINGRLVTKVIYLEQPQLASPVPAGRSRAVPTQTIPPHTDPLRAADLYGRPLAIVRIGSRVPDLEGEHPSFFGVGAPVQPVDQRPIVPANRQPARPE